ncbi:MAG TPA: FCD domain-containing protein [Bradyrhizobium sp.]|nr:FCD domain-containing protein [Bradyrhizobium sp.]
MRILQSKAERTQVDQQLTAEAGEARSIAEFALQRLRSDILSTRLAPGTKLRLGFLTAEYQVGISPLRDALAQLAGDGLVILESQRGFRVASASREDLCDVSGARKRIELAALEMSVGQGDENWDARVRLAYSRFSQIKQKVGDVNPINEEWEKRHREFHLTLLSGCSSPVLLHFCSQLHDRFDRYRRLALPSMSHMAAIGEDHLEIMDAALHRGKQKALALLDCHLEASASLLAEHFRPTQLRL